MKRFQCFCVVVVGVSSLFAVKCEEGTAESSTKILVNATEDDTKIFVNPSNNALNFMRPSGVKPTTEQVEFQPGVPPGWTNKPSSRPTRPPRPTRPTKHPFGPPKNGSLPDFQTTPTVHHFTSKPAIPESSLEVKPALIAEELNATTYPPGVSPPEAIIGEPDRGVIDWLLGLVGINQKPDQGNSGGGSGGGGAGGGGGQPSRTCSKCVCGLTYKHNRIVGGVETQVNEYPWMVVLMYNNRFYCGASIINNKYVLTAGHCVNGFAKEKLLATFLDHDRSTTYETKTFTRRISKILRHRDYGSGGSYNNDIALLQLEEEVPFTGILKPVCLPPTGKSFSGYKGIVTGWGATQAHGQVSNKLREVEVPILSNVDCRKTGYGNRITDNMLCAGYPQGTKDSCQGDSGGPLHIVNGTYHTIVGVVSWGEGCAEPNYPGVYTRVNRYISWIYSNTKDACYC